MDRNYFYKMMAGSGRLDYEQYLRIQRLFDCQKEYHELCTHDELMFQIVHQTEELWMKLIAFTFLEIDDWMREGNSFRVITLMQRVHRIIEIMIDSLAVLETMSPREYQYIRLELGNGSGQESPGFRTLLEMPEKLWASFKENYLDAYDRSVEDIYDAHYLHDDAYMVAEAFADYDKLFRKFRFLHLQLIEKTIGLDTKSLKGRLVKQLLDGCSETLFPDLWTVRSNMTNQWGDRYGTVRAPIKSGIS